MRCECGLVMRLLVLHGLVLRFGVFGLLACGF